MILVNRDIVLEIWFGYSHAILNYGTVLTQAHDHTGDAAHFHNEQIHTNQFV
jgi:hypothetical protein